jgi:hypothetical protein
MFGLFRFRHRTTGAPPAQPLLGADERFLETLTKIRGWLFEPAGVLSIHLIRTLASSSRDDAFIEIGVFEGRYLALLQYASASAQRRVIGVDTFEWIPKAEVEEALVGVLGPRHGIELWQANSQRLDAATVRAHVDHCPIRFVSIDGDHAAPAVQHDLELVDSILSDDGIVAADDFLNPLAIGVTEGLGAFFSTKERSLRPFAYAGNKLFLCRPDRHSHYLSIVRSFVETRTDLSSLAATRAFWEMGEVYFKQRLFGAECLILTRGQWG